MFLPNTLQQLLFTCLTKSTCLSRLHGLCQAGPRPRPLRPRRLSQPTGFFFVFCEHWGPVRTSGPRYLLSPVPGKPSQPPHSGSFSFGSQSKSHLSRDIFFDSIQRTPLKRTSSHSRAGHPVLFSAQRFAQAEILSFTSLSSAALVP